MRRVKQILLGIVIFAGWLCFVLLLQSLGTVSELPTASGSGDVSSGGSASSSAASSVPMSTGSASATQSKNSSAKITISPDILAVADGASVGFFDAQMQPLTEAVPCKGTVFLVFNDSVAVSGLGNVWVLMIDDLPYLLVSEDTVRVIPLFAQEEPEHLPVQVTPRWDALSKFPGIGSLYDLDEQYLLFESEGQFRYLYDKTTDSACQLAPLIDYKDFYFGEYGTSILAPVITYKGHAPNEWVVAHYTLSSGEPTSVFMAQVSGKDALCDFFITDTWRYFGEVRYDHLSIKYEDENNEIRIVVLRDDVVGAEIDSARQTITHFFDPQNPVLTSPDGRYRIHTATIVWGVSSFYKVYIEDVQESSTVALGAFDYNAHLFFADEYLGVCLDGESGIALFTMDGVRLDWQLEPPTAVPEGYMPYYPVLAGLYDDTQSRFVVLAINPYDLKNFGGNEAFGTVDVYFYDWQGQKTSFFSTGIAVWEEDGWITPHIDEVMLSGDTLSFCYTVWESREYKTIQVEIDLATKMVR